MNTITFCRIFSLLSGIMMALLIDRQPIRLLDNELHNPKALHQAIVKITVA